MLTKEHSKEAQENTDGKIDRLLMNELMRSFIIRDKPDFWQLSDFAKTNFLREWVAMNISWRDRINDPEDAGKQEILNHYYKLPFEKLFAKALVGEWGFWCEGFSFILATIYHLFGFKAIVVDVGFKDTRHTHMIVLVRIQHNNKDMIILQDSYFDYTYIDDNNEPIDFAEIISENTAHIKTTVSKINKRRTTVKTQDGNYAYINFLEFKDGLYNRSVNFLVQKGYAKNFLIYYKFPLHIGRSNFSSRQNKLTEEIVLLYKTKITEDNLQSCYIAQPLKFS